MASPLDLSRWQEAPQALNYRRLTIVTTGLRLLLRTRFFRWMLALAWSAGLGIAVAGFVFSQSVATGGWLATLAAHVNPRMEALAAALSGFVALYPDIVVRGIFTLIFWLHSFVGLWLSLIALTVMVPRLIARDRASNALIIYLSRPLNATDYLLGKLGMIAGMIVLVWTGPLVCGWLVSLLFSPSRDFIVYSFNPLLRALEFNGIALVSLAAIALGASALARTSRTAVLAWLGLWLLLASVAAPPNTPAGIRCASFTYDLNQVRQEVIQLDQSLRSAGTTLPLLDRDFARNLNQAGERTRAANFGAALAGLGALIVGSSVVFVRKLRPE